MRVSDIGDGILIPIADMPAGDSGDLDSRPESDLSEQIHILVFEDIPDAEISHDLLVIDLHLLVLDQDIEGNVLNIIIEIRDGYLVVDIIEFRKHLVHLMDSIRHYAAIES